MMKLRYQLILLPTVLLLFAAAEAAAADHQTDDDAIKKFPSLVAWFRAHGGKIDDRITLGYEPNSGIRGIIATETIEPETILMHTPSKLMINAADGRDSNHCDIIQRIIDELNLGIESKWKIYFQFDGSTSSSSPGRVPTQWKRTGEPGSRALTALQVSCM